MTDKKTGSEEAVFSVTKDLKTRWRNQIKSGYC